MGREGRKEEGVATEGGEYISPHHPKPQALRSAEEGSVVPQKGAPFLLASSTSEAKRNQLKRHKEW